MEQMISIRNNNSKYLSLVNNIYLMLILLGGMFAHNVFAQIAITGSYGFGWKTAVLPDGKIVVSQMEDTEVKVLNSNGTVFGSFRPCNRPCRVSSLGATAEGNIVVGITHMPDYSYTFSRIPDVRIYSGATFTYINRLAFPYAVTGDLSAVAVSPQWGGAIAVSVIGNNQKGEVFLFASNFTFSKYLGKPSINALQEDRFGFSLAASRTGDFVASYSYKDPVTQYPQSALAIFSSNTGSSAKQVIQNSKFSSADHPLLAVDFKGNLLVADGYSRVSTYKVGRLFVYSLATGQLLQEIVNPIEHNSSPFGIAVAASPISNHVLVSGYDSQRSVGVVYVYTGQTFLSQSAALNVPARVYSMAASSIGGVTLGMFNLNRVQLYQNYFSPPPVIQQFYAEPSPLIKGNSALLKWQASGATSVSISPATTIPAGATSVSVSPTATTTYTLTVANTSGSVSRPLTLIVKEPDYDNDAMPDPWETTHGLNISLNDALLDLDGDGLNNIGEFNAGTKPNIADTDGDGMFDGYEVQHGLNPLSADHLADHDADGLNNLSEFLVGTNPKKADTDSDGLSDSYEVNHLLNPLVADSNTDADNDGLTNLKEFQANTNPQNADTDADGMLDGYEVTHGLNPLVADNHLDSDDDGLTNLVEHNLGTNPKSKDTDNDGMPDAFEVAVGLNPLLIADAATDVDGDGVSNYYEYLAGTDLNLNTDYPLPQTVTHFSAQDLPCETANCYALISWNIDQYSTACIFDQAGVKQVCAASGSIKVLKDPLYQKNYKILEYPVASSREIGAVAINNSRVNSWGRIKPASNGPCTLDSSTGECIKNTSVNYSRKTGEQHVTMWRVNPASGLREEVQRFYNGAVFNNYSLIAPNQKGYVYELREGISSSGVLLHSYVSWKNEKATPPPALNATPQNCVINEEHETCIVQVHWDKASMGNAAQYCLMNGAELINCTADNFVNVTVGIRPLHLQLRSANSVNVNVLSDVFVKAVVSAGFKLDAPSCVPTYGNSCTTSVSWSAQESTNPCLFKDGQLMACAKAGRLDLPVSTSGTSFSLRNGSIFSSSAELSTMLAKVEDNWLSLSSNSCDIRYPDTQCRIHVSWAVKPTESACIYQNNNEIFCGVNGNQDVLLNAGAHEFSLRQNGSVVRTMTTNVKNLPWGKLTFPAFTKTDETVQRPGGKNCLLAPGQIYCTVRMDAIFQNVSRSNYVTLWRMYEGQWQLFNKKAIGELINGVFQNEYDFVTSEAHEYRLTWRSDDSAPSPNDLLLDQAVISGVAAPNYEYSLKAPKNYCYYAEGESSCKVNVSWLTDDVRFTSLCVEGQDISGLPLCKPSAITGGKWQGEIEVDVPKAGKKLLLRDSNLLLTYRELNLYAIKGLDFINVSECSYTSAGVCSVTIIWNATAAKNCIYSEILSTPVACTNNTNGNGLVTFEVTDMTGGNFYLAADTDGIIEKLTSFEIDYTLDCELETNAHHPACYTPPNIPGDIIFTGLEDTSSPTDTNGSFIVNWGASDEAESYWLEENGVLIYSGVVPGYNVSSLTSGNYTYRVKACKDSAANCSDFTEQKTVSVIINSVSSGSSSSAYSNQSSWGSSFGSSISSSAPTTTQSSSSSSFAAFNFAAEAPAEFTYELDTTTGVPDFTHQAPVWLTQGAVNVDSGNAMVGIDIQLPPAIADLSPALSLAYNSQKGDGEMGIGWGLEGLLYITRCSTTYAIEGAEKAAASNAAYTNADRLCLNGEQLVVRNNLRPTDAQYWASGTEFRTEVDSFARIIGYGTSAYGGFDYFQVISKEGKTLTFGADDSVSQSKVISNKEGTYRISAWALNKAEDRYGNHYSVTYQRDIATNEHYPASIYYAPGSSVVFKYKNRTGQLIAGYDVGALFVKNKLLETVTTYINVSNAATPEVGTPVRRYKVEYRSDNFAQRDLVSDISACAYESSSWSCAQPLSFTWSEGAFGLDMANGKALTYCTGAAFNATEHHFIDVDSDGYTDALLAKTGVITWGTAAGCFEAKNIIESGTAGRGEIKSTQPLLTAQGYGLLRIREFKQKPTDNYASEITAEILYAINKVSGTAAVTTIATFNAPRTDVGVADFNNDGLDDFRFGASTYTQQASFLGFVKSGVPENYYEGYESAGHINLDFDSDGLLDDVSIRASEHDPEYPLDYRIALQSKNFDILGNGSRPRQLTQQCLDLYGTVGQYFHLADINSDGNADFVMHRNSTWRYRLGTGLGVGDEINTANASTSNLIPGSPYSFMYDYDKDGRDDLIMPRLSAPDMCGQAKVLFSRYQNGVQSFTESNSASNAATLIPGMSFLCTLDHNPEVLNTFAGDINNDGLIDAYIDGKAYFTRQGQPNMLETVTNGLGAQIRLTYSNLTSAANNGQPLYLPSADAPVFPQVQANRLMQVVAKVEVSNGKGGLNSRFYNYVGGKSDVRGRGFLGFEKITVTDAAAGLVTTTEYRQDFPFIGMVKNTTTRNLNNLLIGRVDNDYTLRSTGSGNVAFFPVKYLSLKKTYSLLTSDLTSPVSVTRSETTAHNTCGDATHMTTQIGTGYLGESVTGIQSTVQVTHAFNGASSCEYSFQTGTTSQVTNHATGDTQTIQTEFIPNSQNDVKTRIEFKGTPQEVSTTYERRSNGVVESISTSAKDYDGTALPVVTQTLADFQAGLYPQTLTNAMGHVTKLVYDARFGAATASTFGKQLLKSETVLDAFGNETAAIASDGTRSTSYSFFCNASTPITCAQGAAYGVATLVTNPAAVGYYGQPPMVVFYDQLQREIRRVSYGFGGKVSNVVTEYNSNGTVARVSEPYLTADMKAGVYATHWTLYSDYDALGRPRLVTAPDGGTATNDFATDPLGIKSSQTQRVLNPEGSAEDQTSVTYHNVLGQVVRVQDAMLNTVDYSYYATGNLKSTIVNNLPSTQIDIGYDIAGNKTYVSDPNAKDIYFDYNGFGELRRQIWKKDTAAQKSMLYKYDNLGRVVERIDTPASGTPVVNAWKWDERQSGVLDSVEGNGYKDIYYYDGHSRVSRRETVIAGLSSQSFRYFYDKFGRPETEAYPNNFKVERKYHALGFMARVNDVSIETAPKVLWALGDQLDQKGNLTHSLFGNGVMTHLTFAPDSGRIKTIQSGRLSGTNTITAFNPDVQNLGYVFDSAGNLRRRSSDKTYANGKPVEALYETFRYDALNRLKRTVTRYGGLAGHLDFGGNETSEIDYDNLGNITSKTRFESGSVVNTDVGIYKYDHMRNAGPHAVTAVGTTQYGYDAYGNMTQRGTETLEYSVFNKPTKITGSNVSTLTYGPDHQLYKEVSSTATSGTKTTYKLGGYELEVNGSQTIQKSYVDGQIINSRTLLNNIESENTFLFLHTDSLGSLESTTDAKGQLVNRASFDSWGGRRQPTWAKGAPSDAFVTTTGFTGHHQLDAHKLIHMGGRVYDPAIGRFLSADIVVQAPLNSQNYNRYSYVINNPLSLTDPSGYCYTGSYGPNTIIMMIEAQHHESFLSVKMASGGGWRAAFAAHNAANRPSGSTQAQAVTSEISKHGLTFNADKTAIVDRNGNTYATPQGLSIAAASGNWDSTHRGLTSNSGGVGAGQGAGGGVPDSGTGVDAAPSGGGTVDNNWDNYGEPMSSWSFGSIGENFTELVGVCDITCWGSSQALIRSAAISLGLSPQEAHRRLEYIDYATMVGNPVKIFAHGIVKTSVIGPIRIGGGAKGALRPVGQLLESVDDVLANPRLLREVSPAQLMSRINKSDKWVVGSMNKTRSENKGFTLRELNSRGTDYTDRYIQYHPGSSRHFNGQPYWKVSSGSGGTDRFPVYGE